MEIGQAGEVPENPPEEKEIIDQRRQNMKEILVSRWEERSLVYEEFMPVVIERFCEILVSGDKLSEVEMLDIFDEVIRLFTLLGGEDASD